MPCSFFARRGCQRHTGRAKTLPFLCASCFLPPPVLRPIGDPAPLLGMASPISESLPKREKCAMIQYISSSAASAPDQMHPQRMPAATHWEGAAPILSARSMALSRPPDVLEAVKFSLVALCKGSVYLPKEPGQRIFQNFFQLSASKIFKKLKTVF